MIEIFEIYSTNNLKLPDLDLLDQLSILISDQSKYLNLT
jgi:hypothetical protein